MISTIIFLIFGIIIWSSDQFRLKKLPSITGGTRLALNVSTATMIILGVAMLIIKGDVFDLAEQQKSAYYLAAILTFTAIIVVKKLFIWRITYTRKTEA